MNHIHLDPAGMAAGEIYRIMTACIVPRPIAWVSSLDAGGNGNLAPFSFYTLLSTVPPLVALSISSVNGNDKDTAANIQATQEFVINFVTMPLLVPMHASSAAFPAGTDEAQALGVAMEKSQCVQPQGVAQSPVRLECRLSHILSFGHYKTKLIVGEIVRISISSACMTDGKIDGALLDPVGRMGGGTYTESTDRIRMLPAEKPPRPSA